MKLLIILIFSLSAHASYFIPEADFPKCQAGESVVFYSQAERCAKVSGRCVKLETVNCAIMDMEDELANGEPIYEKKSHVTACETEEACEALRLTLCPPPFDFYYSENLILSGYEAYCTKVIGHEKVKTGRKVLKENASKKAAWLAELEAKRLAEEEAKAREEAIQAKMRELAEAALLEEGN